MWTTARYRSTSLFSLRPALSTASGAQSLLVPTPFAIKMALVNVAIQRFGLPTLVRWWPIIRGLDIALDVPEFVVVNKTFIKIQRKTDLPKQKGIDKDAFITEKLHEGKWPLSPTIAFREFVQFDGDFGIALHTEEWQPDIPLATLLALVNYFGKRGGFFQLQSPPEIVDAVDRRWTLLTQPASTFPINGTLQMLDDCGANLTWEHVDVFSSKSIALGGKERVLQPIVLPYELRRSSYRYSLYERIDV